MSTDNLPPNIPAAHAHTENPTDILQRLDQILTERQNTDPQSSYVASLFNKGLNKILEKIGEEATELVIAGKNLEQTQQEAQRDEMIYETADLWFHSMIALSYFNIDSKEVLIELERRFGLSGIQEKASRSKPTPTEK